MDEILDFDHAPLLREGLITLTANIFEKWTNANPMTIFSRAATASKL
jgi:hypothetical protein